MKNGNMSASKALGIVRRALIPLAVLLVALSLSVLAYEYVNRNVRAQEKVRFDETVSAKQAAIARRTDSYFDAILGARGVFLASESVSRQEWLNYVGSLNAGERFPGLEALCFAQLSTKPEGEMRFPMTYVAPSNDAANSLSGQDFYSEADHRATMNRARDTGQATITGIGYVPTQAASVGDYSRLPGFFVYLPVYTVKNTPDTVAERRRELKGFVVGVIGMKGLLKDVSTEQSSNTLDFEVYDGGVNARSIVYDDDGVERGWTGETPELFAKTKRIELGQRHWTMYFATLPQFEKSVEDKRLGLFVLASGILMSLLLFAVTWMLVSNRNRAERASLDLESANRELEATNRELEAFSYSVSHDLRAPLRSIDGFSQILLEDYTDVLDEEGANYLGRVRAASQRMGQLIDDLLVLSRMTRTSLRREIVDLSALAQSVADELRERDPNREVEFSIAGGLSGSGDARLLRVTLENLLGNAWKFTSGKEGARIEFGAMQREGSPGFPAYFVRDNGAGFDMAYAGKLFGAFQRLHSPEEFEGTGIGLATVQRVIRRHGGAVWAEGEVGRGATFYFTLGNGPRRESDAGFGKDGKKDRRTKDRIAPGSGPSGGV